MKPIVRAIGYLEKSARNLPYLIVLVRLYYAPDRGERYFREGGNLFFVK
jgi:hypothetical protein